MSDLRYVAAARRVFTGEHIAEGDTTRCGLDLLDPDELWQDIPEGQGRTLCRRCAGQDDQEALL